MTHVLSLARRLAGGNAVDNHRTYAAERGYGFSTVGSLHISNDRMRTVFGWHAIAAKLDTLADDEILLVVQDDAVFYEFHAIESFMAGRDNFVMGRLESDDHANCSAICLRKTPAVCQSIGELLFALAEWLNTFSLTCHKVIGELVAEKFKPHIARHAAANGIVFNLQIASYGESAFAVLGLVQVLLASEPTFIQTEAGEWQEMAVNDHAYLDYVCRKRAGRADAEFAVLEPETLTINPTAPLQFVSLNTPEIASFARFHEEDMVKYCQRHGYGYTSYRRIPEIVPSRHGPSWAKPFLLRHHLADAATVVWIDADIRVGNFSIAIDDVIGPHDICVARDHAFYYFNSGVMAFRKSALALTVLDDVCAAIDAVDATDSVYASGGDQEYFNDVFVRHGLAVHPYVRDSLVLNARPPFATGDTLFVHFSGLWTVIRTDAMQHWTPLDPDAPTPYRR
ncbi:MAG: hypothetical protein H7267_01240 [Sandarakinorhabdus sp.]|nr:hypothetical protein [Sandarakinorhabdus sp.]